MMPICGYVTRRRARDRRRSPKGPPSLTLAWICVIFDNVGRQSGVWSVPRSWITLVCRRAPFTGTSEADGTVCRWRLRLEPERSAGNQDCAAGWLPSEGRHRRTLSERGPGDGRFASRCDMRRAELAEGYPVSVVIDGISQLGWPTAVRRVFKRPPKDVSESVTVELFFEYGDVSSVRRSRRTSACRGLEFGPRSSLPRWPRRAAPSSVSPISFENASRAGHISDRPAQTIPVMNRRR